MERKEEMKQVPEGMAYYAPLCIIGKRLEKMDDLPEGYEVFDQNEFQRIYVHYNHAGDGYGQFVNDSYVYNIKNPKSPLYERISQDNDN